MIYWDTSAIVPLYVEEACSAFWESKLRQSGECGHSSTLAVTEFSYALKHKVFREKLSARAANALIEKFTQDCEAGQWLLCPLGSDVIEASLKVVGISYASKVPVPLRSLDGLHLGAALTLKCDMIATDDRRLADAAKQLDLEVLSAPLVTPLL